MVATVTPISQAKPARPTHADEQRVYSLGALCDECGGPTFVATIWCDPQTPRARVALCEHVAGAARAEFAIRLIGGRVITRARADLGGLRPGWIARIGHVIPPTGEDMLTDVYFEAKHRKAEAHRAAAELARVQAELGVA